MATIKLVSYEKLLNYPLEYCCQSNFALFHRKHNMSGNCCMLKLKNIFNYYIQTVLSTPVVGVFISN